MTVMGCPFHWIIVHSNDEKGNKGLVTVLVFFLNITSKCESAPKVLKFFETRE